MRALIQIALHHGLLGVHFRVRGQCTHRAIAEVFAFDAKGVIETRAVVFPRDRGRQFDKLRFVEILAQAIEERVGDFYGSLRHRVRVFEHQPIQVGEIGIRPVARQARNLLYGDPVCPTDGRADVNSKRTANERGDPEFGQILQSRIDELASRLRLFHLPIPPQDSRVVSIHLHGQNQPAKPALSH